MPSSKTSAVCRLLVISGKPNWQPASAGIARPPQQQQQQAPQANLPGRSVSNG